VKFFFDGKKLNESSTPASLDVEEDDECQIGGFLLYEYYVFSLVTVFSRRCEDDMN
jgi:hypothetical protein